MQKYLKVDNFTPFISKWGMMVEPSIFKNGFFVPDGWQSELKRKKITFEEFNGVPELILK